MSEVRVYDPTLFYPGMTVEVLTQVNRLLFLGKIEKVEGDSIEVVEAEGRELPSVIYSTDIKLRGRSADGEIIILQGKIGGSSERFWKIDRLETQNIREKRAFYRQYVNAPSRVVLIKNERLEELREMVGRPCHVVDVSLGGALIHSRESYQVGDRLFLPALELLHGEAPFSFVCHVLRVTESRTGSLYACSFEKQAPREQERLLRTIFKVQRKAIHRERP